MRIAQVAPLYESVPPKKYGGTERVVSWLTEELVSLGHDVTLFAIEIRYQGDVRRAVRIVFDLRNAARDARFIALEIDQAIKPLMTAAAPTDRDSPVAIAA